MTFFRSFRDQSGFTLIEIIVVIIILGVIGSLAGMGVSSLAQGFIAVRDTAETMGKGQMAVTRLVKEFGAIRSVTAAPTVGFPPVGTSITYRRSDSPTTDRTVVWAGGTNPLRLEGQILSDEVTNFAIRYFNNYNDVNSSAYSATDTAIIEVAVTMRGGTVLTNRIVLRKQFS